MTGPNRPKGYWWALAVLVTVAIALPVGAIDLFFQAASQDQAGSPIPGGVRTTGTVVSSIKNTDERGGSTYTPVIDFTANGQDYTFQGIYADSKPRDGSSVTVSYDPADPADAHDLSGGSGNVIVDSALGAGLLIFEAVLAVVVVRGRRRKRRSDAAAAAKAEPEWDPTWDESLRDAPRDSDPGR